MIELSLQIFYERKKMMMTMKMLIKPTQKAFRSNLMPSNLASNDKVL